MPPDKFNLDSFRIDSSDNCHANNFFGENVHSDYVVYVPYDPYMTAIENGLVLFSKVEYIKELALIMSDNIESPATGVVPFDWFRPTLVIESGYYDLDGKTIYMGGLKFGDPDGRSEHFNIRGANSPHLGINSDTENSAYLPAVGMGNPNVWIQGEVVCDPGFRQDIVGIMFDGDILAGASNAFYGCWFTGTVEAATNTMGNYFSDCRFDSPVCVTTRCGASFNKCNFTDGSTQSFLHGFQETSEDKKYFTRCNFLGEDFFQNNYLESTVYFDDCIFNGVGVFQPAETMNFGVGKYVLRNCEIFDNDGNAWWDDFTSSPPVANEFIRCEGLALNQATQASRIVFCVDKDNAVMSHK